MLRIEHLDDLQDVYDISVDNNENFYANGILVHNCEIALPTTPMGSAKTETSTIDLEDLTEFLLLQGRMEKTTRLISIDPLEERAVVEVSEDTSRIALCISRRSTGASSRILHSSNALPD